MSKGLIICSKCYTLQPKDQYISNLINAKEYTKNCLTCRNKVVSYYHKTHTPLTKDKYECECGKRLLSNPQTLDERLRKHKQSRRHKDYIFHLNLNEYNILLYDNNTSN